MKKLKYWFTMWQLQNYPVSALIPNWYKNLSVYWSPKEQRTQHSLEVVHGRLGELLVDPDADTNWGLTEDSGDTRQALPLESRKLYP